MLISPCSSSLKTSRSSLPSSGGQHTPGPGLQGPTSSLVSHQAYLLLVAPTCPDLPLFEAICAPTEHQLSAKALDPFYPRPLPQGFAAVSSPPSIPRRAKSRT